MIEAKELRIGNHIDFKGNLQNRQNEYVEPIDIEVISHSPELVDPIPLTEEWLIKFSFKERFAEGSNLYRHNMFEIFLVENSKNEWYIDDGIRTFDIKLKYVHQLQNFYYALTQKELEYIK